MKQPVSTWIWISLQLALLGLFVWGMILQTRIQNQTNQTVQRVSEHIIRARELSKETNSVLLSLSRTTDLMETINENLQSTEQTLRSMNSGIARVVGSEKRIVANLETWHHHADNMSKELASISDLHRQLSPVARTVSEQTAKEDKWLKDLASLTDETVRQFRILNGKLAWLGLLP
ncbi:methyl-accepting chemotaxis protein [Staphylospora marina]|uniref:methyl-accepting chemotaxis protein n=1 Tax=Staphylospora marina TaxID=2490858 RepID=UPI000F5B93B6|nr:methyl-accepting chemotaxis protein [Staphylospora marina]